MRDSNNSLTWETRQRNTRALIRSLGASVLADGEPSGDALYGLTKLTWIALGGPENQSYIKSTKIPALQCIMGKSAGNTLEAAAREADRRYPRAELEQLVLAPTGFTNAYNAYRWSSQGWFRKNRKKIAAIFRDSLQMRSEAGRLRVAAAIHALPPVPHANPAQGAMEPASFITPVVMCLDPQCLFPVINKNKGVEAALIAAGVVNDDLPTKVSALSARIDGFRFVDSIDLDGFLSRPEGVEQASSLFAPPDDDGRMPGKTYRERSGKKGTSRGSHGERDRDALHDRMTNVLVKQLEYMNYTVLSGAGNGTLYDLLIRDYRENLPDVDLLMEIKSSTSPADIRQAVGQLLHYRFKGKTKPNKCHLAVVTPGMLAGDIVEFLAELNIGVLSMGGASLKYIQASTPWLRHLQAKIKPEFLTQS